MVLAWGLPMQPSGSCVVLKMASARLCLSYTAAVVAKGGLPSLAGGLYPGYLDSQPDSLRVVGLFHGS